MALFWIFIFYLFSDVFPFCLKNTEFYYFKIFILFFFLILLKKIDDTMKYVFLVAEEKFSFVLS